MFINKMYKNTLYILFQIVRLQDIKACFHKIKLKLTFSIPLEKCVFDCIKKQNFKLFNNFKQMIYSSTWRGGKS